MRFLAAASILALAACATAPEPLQAAAAPSADAPDGSIRAAPMPSQPLDLKTPLRRIVFASCAHQNEDQSMWARVAAENPDLVLFIGDNVYGDVRSNDAALPELKAAYMRLAASEPFARLRAAAPVLTTWDDHDYGLNDAGVDYRFKAQSEALYEYAWALGPDDPRRRIPGVYAAWNVGPKGERAQIILLDTRYFRSPLKATDEPNARGKERYVPDTDKAKTMLGDAQWRWLKETLEQPADLRIIVSSVQVIADGHGWESWDKLPAERERLYDVIDDADAGGVILLSGDRHAAALYERRDVIDYPLFEATSSSINLPASKWRAESGETYVEPGPHRLGGMIYDANYGLLEVDWEKRSLAVSIRGADGAAFTSRTIDFGRLRD